MTFALGSDSPPVWQSLLPWHVHFNIGMRRMAAYNRCSPSFFAWILRLWISSPSSSLILLCACIHIGIHIGRRQLPCVFWHGQNRELQNTANRYLHFRARISRISSDVLDLFVCFHGAQGSCWASHRDVLCRKDKAACARWAGLAPRQCLSSPREPKSSYLTMIWPMESYSDFLQMLRHLSPVIVCLSCLSVCWWHILLRSPINS